jgi:hypothetical protein
MSCVTPREQITLYCPTLGMSIAEKLARAGSPLPSVNDDTDGARE